MASWRRRKKHIAERPFTVLLAADDTAAEIMKCQVVKDLVHGARKSSLNLQAATATDFRQKLSRVAVGSTVEMRILPDLTKARCCERRGGPLSKLECN
ncbi:hypothetical protein [Mesorhizobium amorphae]|uniref:Uncharacterized protein n=1 Tax=Mesorhizobium amorphae CCNWGS0123 TaxID=1082933 RepID=G6Y2S1_9HYPH|nr:hypothetical protein [Mesorhizobium amorphae]ANT54920.1 hypothetical protein A6B35_33845 [Mesorhizobium amorphae CCNWGS0123]EHH13962.1 hypothetical protein MEA186_01061 [Mesorhizobium amorphae CCNWGS0123]